MRLCVGIIKQMSRSISTDNRLGTGRLLSFSDGVIAVIITILVLEFKVPSGYELRDLAPLLPSVVAYLLSFRQVATFWANHHHLLRLAHRADGRLIWANMNLLFMLSLMPFSTAWAGEHYDRPLPIALFGIVSLLAGITYNILQRVVLAEYPSSVIKNTRFERNIKGRLSLIGYASGVLLAFVSTWISIGIYIAIAIVWLVPERRVDEIANKTT